jgi:hypothetical protein
MDLKGLDQPKSITALLWPAANPHFASFDHVLRRPHAVEVGEISTGLRLNSRLHHIKTGQSMVACPSRFVEGATPGSGLPASFGQYYGVVITAECSFRP